MEGGRANCMSKVALERCREFGTASQGESCLTYCGGAKTEWKRMTENGMDEERLQHSARRNSVNLAPMPHRKAAHARTRTSW